MILSKAPLRVSFFGGSSDLPAFYAKDIGHTISMTIDKYVYVSVMHTPYNHIKASYSKQEVVTDIEDLEHDIIKQTLKYFGISSNIEITTFADIPTVGTGLGGSSAFTCALVAALFKYIKGKPPSPRTIAETSCYIEINMCGHNIGKQDQYASAFGGMNYCTYYEDKIDVMILDDNDISLYCVLVPTLLDRVPAHKMIDSIDIEAKRANISHLARIATSISDFSVLPLTYGETLDLAWSAKKKTSSLISNNTIDEIYNRCKSLGAIGCKLLGAGGGGYILAITENRERIISSFPDRTCLTFNISHEGARVVYSD